MFLGELDKWSTVNNQRIKKISVEVDEVSVKIKFLADEVSIDGKHVYYGIDEVVYSVNCQINDAGSPEKEIIFELKLVQGTCIEKNDIVTTSEPLTTSSSSTLFNSSFYFTILVLLLKIRAS